MSNLAYQDNKFTFFGMNGSKMVLDCSNFLANKSRVSMHKLPDQDFLTIPEVIARLIEREKRIGEEIVMQLALMDTLLAAHLIRTSQPVRVLEYGCLNGRLSWHLAEMLGTFHEGSTLVCAYDTIEPEWMQRISEVEKMPKLSYIAGDFGQMHLEKGFFDIVVINGMVNFQNPQDVLEYAIRLTADDGVVLCFSDDTPLLESTFKLYFEARDEYEMLPSLKILQARRKNCCWSRA